MRLPLKPILSLMLLLAVIMAGCSGPARQSSTSTSPVLNTTTPTQTQTATAKPTETFTVASTNTETPETIRLELPEKFEDMQVIELTDVKLVYDTMKQYYNENAWPDQNIFTSGNNASNVFDFLPTDVVNIGINSRFSLTALMFRVTSIKDTEMYLVAIPATHRSRTDEILDQGIFCFLYNPSATAKFIRESGSDDSVYEKTFSPQAIFQAIHDESSRYLYTMVLTDSGINQRIVELEGWQVSLDVNAGDRSLSMLDKKFPHYFDGFYDEEVRERFLRNVFPVFQLQIH